MPAFEAYQFGPPAMEQRGFKITFENGVTVSVAFGAGNYCNGGETTAETATWREGGKTENVTGWQTPAEVLKTLNEAASLPKE